MSFYIAKTPDLWLDGKADGGTTVSGGRVESFVDQSGNGRDFTSSGVNRPYLNAAQNGVDFKNDAGEQDMSAGDTQYMSYSGSDLIHSGEWEVWAVVSSVENDSRGIVISTREYSGTIHKRVDTQKVQFFGSTSTHEAFYKSDQSQAGKSDQSPDVLEARMVASGIYARLNDESENQGSTNNNTGSLASTSTLIGVEDTGGMVDSFKGVIHELIVIKGGTTAQEREDIRTALIDKWASVIEPPEEQEIFEASFEDASGRDPLPTALIERTPARRLANHNVIVYRYPPYMVTKRVPIELADYPKTLPGNMLWHKDENDALFLTGRWAQIQGRRFTDNPFEVELTLRISDHSESFEEPT